jgi:hypothetical protein
VTNLVYDGDSTDWGYPAVLLTGKVGSPGESLSGFSDATGWVNNILIRTTTISNYSSYGANANGAVQLLRGVAGHVSWYSTLFCPPYEHCYVDFGDDP